MSDDYYDDYEGEYHNSDRKKQGAREREGPILDGCVSCDTEYQEDTGPVVCHRCLTDSIMAKKEKNST